MFEFVTDEKDAGRGLVDTPPRTLGCEGEADAGRPLGLVGKTGLATGPHLHFEVWRGGEARDPLPWLGVATDPGSAGN